MEDIIIEETNYKAFALTMAYLFLLLAALSITIFGMLKHKIMLWFPGIVVDFLFLIGFIGALMKVTNAKKLLTITVDGIIDDSSLGGVGFISFDDIKEFQIITLFNKKAIAVIPKNIDSFLSNLPVVKRRTVRRNISQNLPAVAIHVDMAKDMEPEDILSLLQKRLLDYSSLYD
jgi:hypothetical protein